MCSMSRSCRLRISQCLMLLCFYQCLPLKSLVSILFKCLSVHLEANNLHDSPNPSKNNRDKNIL